MLIYTSQLLQRHLMSSDMHYGNGMMNEEIERARKRAEAVSSRKSGHSYQSPLGNGFTFNKDRPSGQQSNPYSIRRQRNQNQQHNDDEIRIQYEESYLEMNGGDFDTARQVMKAKESVVERMNVRRRNRIRERGDPNPYLTRRGPNKDEESTGCAIM